MTTRPFVRGIFLILALATTATVLSGCKDNEVATPVSSWTDIPFGRLVGTWRREDGVSIAVSRYGDANLSSFGAVRIAQAGSDYAMSGLSNKGAFRCVYRVSTNGRDRTLWRVVSSPGRLCPEGTFVKAS